MHGPHAADVLFAANFLQNEVQREAILAFEPDKIAFIELCQHNHDSAGLLDVDDELLVQIARNP
jgi:hypothetical protein